MDVVDAAPLPEPAAIGIFRIFQEMLSNVGRHARASEVAIAITATARDTHITVRDNSQGADAAAFEAADAYGMIGMRERARHLGGSIEINSQKGRGSRFHLRIYL